MKIIAQALLVLFAMVLLTISCTESTTIGADLLEQDQADIRFTDTISIRASTFKVDSVKAYDPIPEEETESYDTYLCGNMAEPIFGLAEASIYTQYNLNQSDPPNFQGVALDSIVLSIVLDTAGTYGDLSVPQEFEIFRLTEEMESTIDIEYYSDQTFATESTPIGTVRFIPETVLEDSLDVSYIVNSRDTLLKVTPHLRVKLDLAFGESIMRFDSLDYTKNTSFLSLFNGLHIKPIADSKSMISFDFFSDFSSLSIYYHDSIEVDQKGQYNFNVTLGSSVTSSSRLSNFNHDFAGTAVETAFGDVVIGDSILYLQGMAGPFIQMDFPYITDLNGSAINKAELVFTIANRSDEATYPAPEQIFILQRNDDGQLSVIPDIDVADARNNIGGIFGGVITNESDGTRTYRMNVPLLIQRMAQGELSSTIFIGVHPKHERANGTLLYGPKHSQYPVKLNVAYTNL